ncbi:glycoside hydrolase family 47 protein [Mucor ambiguus]|uniref:alpha-1,2-Mannosidase n=1 Tax=Mucor ambiguus TaxID=91626 RepID=A0A0C9LVG2_9FUNG|nr:glycoside hydrolase family 47 protein [Mucor ambiguus]
MWVLTGSSSKLPLDEANLSPQSTANDKDARIEAPSAIPPAPKQNILLGFGGFLSKLPQIQHNFGPEPLAYTRLRERRRAAVKKSFLHGWKGYTTYAFGHDELKPLSNKPKDPFGGWGATMVDALSTLAVMELPGELLKVMPRLHKINFTVDEDISVFESIIRYLGGFLSAFELTERKQDMLLQKAEKLAQELLPAFDTPSGLPHHLWNPVQNKPNNRETLIAEVGTVQLEFMMLSQLSGNPIYGQKAQAITDFLDKMGYEHGIYIKGLYPTSIDTHKGRFKDAIATFGAMGDSAFEYFLKEHLLVDGTIPQYGRMYMQSIRSMKQYMLRQIPGYDMLLLPPFNTQTSTSKNAMDHLTCFVPGMLAMGAKTFNEPEDMEIAKGLMETCVFMYRTTKTGLSPENWVVSKTEAYNPMTFNKTKEELQSARDWWYDDELQNPLIKPQLNESLVERVEAQQKVLEEERDKESQEYFVDYKLPPVKKRPDSLFFGDKRYILRPETVESLFILYRITGDQKYQEYGWEIYQAIEKHCKTKSAYATIRNVDRIRGEDDDDEGEPLDGFNQIDSMESFLFAETFKYLYLLFSPPEIISLDKFVFNTEAHPFIRRQWNWDKIFK